MSPERRHQLDELRRRQIREEALLTSSERLARAEGLRAAADALNPTGRSRADEPAELLVRQRQQRLERFGRSRPGDGSA